MPWEKEDPSVITSLELDVRDPLRDLASCKMAEVLASPGDGARRRLEQPGHDRPRDGQRAVGAGSAESGVGATVGTGAVGGTDGAAGASAIIGREEALGAGGSGDFGGSGARRGGSIVF